MRRQRALALALLLVALPLTAPLAPALVPASGPLVNPEFTLGSPVYPYEPASPIVAEHAGSVAPGATEAHPGRPAFAWAHRAISERARPHGTATWHDGTVRVVVDPRDTGAETAVLTQATGRRETLGLWTDPTHVTVAVASVAHAPVRLFALYAAVEDPHALRVSTPAIVLPGPEPRNVTLAFPDDGGTMSQFFLAFQAAEGARTVVHVDAVYVRGATLDPRAGWPVG